jgi:DNA-directed RNA polymerase specialized sigma24 family protein
MSPAKKLRELGQQDFDRLLSWLDADRERAGFLYEQIRWRLVAILAARGCALAEELADETIDRVARRVTDIHETYRGDKALYFLGVMNNVHHEYLRRPPPPRLIQPDEDVEAREEVHLCLDNCLAQLAPYSRQLIERYYAENKQAKIDLRKVIAREMGIKASSLRLRALRIREKLQTCIARCLHNVSEARPRGPQPGSPAGVGR